MKTFMKKNEALVYSAVGLAALFLILVAANYLVSLQSARIDLTEGKVQTLSEGTKKLLRGLESPVKVKLYISRGEQAMPVPLRSFAQRVEDLVREFKAVAGPNLILEKYNPKPDSDEEDAAQLDGVDKLKKGAALPAAAQADRAAYYARTGGAAYDLIKTLNEGIAAVFHEPLGAIRAGLAMRELNESDLSVAIHRGPAMVATLNDHLDYFGATVSTAEQLLATAPQHGSAAQLVVSNAIAMDEAVAEIVAARQLTLLVEQQLATAPQAWLHRVQPIAR